MVETSQRYFIINEAIAMNVKSSRTKVFFKKTIIEKRRKIHIKTPVLESLFSIRLQRPQHSCFSVNFVKFLRRRILQNI